MKWFYRILKKPFFGRYMVPWRNPLDAAGTARWDKTWLDSQTGGRIRVWMGKAEGKTVRGVIVLGHSMGKPAKADFLKTGYADALRMHGYHVFLFDFNGFGESSLGNFQFHYDVLAVRDLARRMYPNLPLGYHGISFGTNWGSVAFQEADNPFQRAILESSPVNLLEFWVKYPGPYRLLKFLFFWVPSQRQYTDFEAALSRSQHLNELLLVYSDEDDLTPPAFGERMKASSVASARLEIFPGAEHTKIIESDRERFLKMAFEFFDEMK